MKKAKQLAAALMAIIYVLGSAYTAYGYTFPDDVPVGHWAYNSIDRVTNLGLMTGQTVSKFGVNELIDKFDTARILAALAGYKASGATYEEYAYYEQCYAAHIGTVRQYSQSLAKWRHEYDMEITYLLELGILSPTDVRDFMGIEDGAEQRFALLRYQFCVFLARLLGVDDIARSFVPASLFTDDHDILPAVKPYVYYMRHIGMVTGDGSDYFYPRSGVTRSAMAVMLDKTINLLGFGGSQPAEKPGGQQQASGNYGTVIGRIYQVYPSFKAIEVQNLFTGKRDIYHVLNNASIIIDGAPGYFDLLEAGMEITGVLLNDDVQELLAMSPASGGYENHQPAPNNPPDPGIMQNAIIEGIVKGTKIISNQRYIDIDVKLINTMGEIIEETRTFLLEGDCEIRRGTHQIDYLSINPGDIATLTIAGTTTFNIYLEEKYRNISGTVTARRAVDATGMGVLTVKDTIGRTHELVTYENTVITRLGHAGIPSWRDIRIGDAVEISAEYNQILSVAAVGKQEFKDIVVTKLLIAASGTEITGIENGKEATYPVIPSSTVDPYQIKLGSKVRIGLDSMEIESIMVIEDPQTNDMTGYIRSKAGDRIHLQNIVNSNIYSFDFADNMVVTNANTGTVQSSSALVAGMRVYLVYAYDAGKNINYITNITILGY